MSREEELLEQITELAEQYEAQSKKRIRRSLYDLLFVVCLIVMAASSIHAHIKLQAAEFALETEGDILKLTDYTEAMLDGDSAEVVNKCLTDINRYREHSAKLTSQLNLCMGDRANDEYKIVQCDTMLVDYNKTRKALRECGATLIECGETIEVLTEQLGD